MGEKNPDDIMAECLLAGGKMLSKACRACGSPLFEVKGETLCVVCREKGKEKGKGAPAPAAAPAPAMAATAARAAPAGETEEERELRAAIAALARRAREETDPERCLALLSAAREAAEALSLLHL
ncbi:MAG: hypothetical protein LUO96_01755 [Methanomicrobiales archaeon]|nr:hypothetical protein [Methanomicrobiales archaeon]